MSSQDVQHLQTFGDIIGLFDYQDQQIFYLNVFLNKYLKLLVLLFLELRKYTVMYMYKIFLYTYSKNLELKV